MPWANDFTLLKRCLRSQKGRLFTPASECEGQGRLHTGKLTWSMTVVVVSVITAIIPFVRVHVEVLNSE